MEKQIELQFIEDSPLFNPITLDEAREYVKEGRKVGVFCPCCKQYAKIYKRQIHSTIARMLIRAYWIQRHNNLEYLHISLLAAGLSITGTNDFHKFAYWGLVSEKPKDLEDTTARTSGEWTLTPKGISFVECKLSIPKYSLVYNNEVLCFEGENVSIKECLGKHFNYEELMNEIINY